MQEHIRIKKKNSRSPYINTGLSKKRNDHSHPLLKMQQTVGNKATVQLREGLGTLQTKLNIGQPHDIYEQEADTVARRIVNQISQTAAISQDQNRHQNQSVHMIQKQEEEEPVSLRRTDEIQRQAEPEEEEEEKSVVQTRQSENIQRQEEEEYAQPRLSEQIQRQPLEEEEEMLQPRQVETVQRQEDEEMLYEKQTRESHAESSGSGVISESVENQVKRERQGGEALDTSTRAQMESGFGYDFSQVHIHNNTTSDQIARQINAEAFTLKGDIFFRNGRYNPASTQGQDLLAHELTHVVQQGAAPSPDTKSVAPL